jgi:hypothetical protein
MSDREVSVNLGDVLDEETSRQFSWISELIHSHRISHVNHSHGWAFEFSVNSVISLLVLRLVCDNV